LFLPPDLAEKLSFSGKTLLGGLAILQIFGALRPVKKIDHLDHLIGMTVGAVAAQWWRSNQEKEGGWKKNFTTWWQTLPGANSR
jgi:hypothetical protein